jgi:hypothetical protein
MTQTNLGIALSEQGGRTSGQVSEDLLNQAVAAFRRALEVYTRATFPQQWATTQHNLGTALSEQARHNNGKSGPDLWAQAVAALRSALEVRSRATVPQDWAATQNRFADGERQRSVGLTARSHTYCCHAARSDQMDGQPSLLYGTPNKPGKNSRRI